MQTVRLAIDYPKTKRGKSAWCKIYGLNAYYSGKHWAQRSKDAEAWHIMVTSAINRQRKLITMFDKPVEIVFRHNDGMDCSNHAAINKMIEDGLKGRVIKDDDRKHVVRHVTEFHDGDYIEVIIREVPDNVDG